jgi:hypothetical protein
MIPEHVDKMHLLNTDEWEEIKFPDNFDIVYIIYAEKDGVRKPIYVGESGRYFGRFGDYISMQFKAPGDFKVGSAIRYLKKKGFSVLIKYKNSNDRKKEEKVLRQELENKFNLLNQLSGYIYNMANKQKEKNRIKEYVDKKIINQWVVKKF